MGYEWQGFDQVQATLAEMKATLSGTAQERMVRAGSAVFEKEVIDAAPVLKPGTAGATSLPPQALKQSIGTTLRKRRTPVSAVVGPRGKAMKLIAYDVEYGHRSVHHGVSGADVEPHPFVRPAYEKGLEPAQQAMVEELGKMIGETGNA